MTDRATFLALLLVSATFIVLMWLPFLIEGVRWLFHRKRAREWTLAHGSPELRQLLEDGISWRATYQRERLEHERPDWSRHFLIIPHSMFLKFLWQYRTRQRLTRMPRYADLLERARADQPDARLIVNKGYDPPVRAVARFGGTWIEYRPSRYRRPDPGPRPADPTPDPEPKGPTLH